MLQFQHASQRYYHRFVLSDGFHGKDRVDQLSQDLNILGFLKEVDEEACHLSPMVFTFPFSSIKVVDVL
jgi:hypothetical protein